MGTPESSNINKILTKKHSIKENFTQPSYDVEKVNKNVFKRVRKKIVQTCLGTLS